MQQTSGKQHSLHGPRNWDTLAATAFFVSSAARSLAALAALSLPASASLSARTFSSASSIGPLRRSIGTAIGTMGTSTAIGTAIGTAGTTMAIGAKGTAGLATTGAMARIGVDGMPSAAKHKSAFATRLIPLASRPSCVPA
jgi:hypothetical protein